MKTSGKFVMVTHNIELDSFSKYFYIVPFMDVHWAGIRSKRLGSEAWKRFKKFMKETPNAHYVGNGDYIDFARSSVQAKIKAQLSREDHNTFDERQRLVEEDFAEQFKDCAGTFVGFGDGNHGWEDVNGVTDAERLSKRIGGKYLGVMCIIRFRIDINNSKKSIYYVQHHGKGGGGKTIGAQFNVVDDLSKWLPQAHIVVMGDNHGLGVVPANSRMIVNCNNGGLRLVAHTPLLIRGGSFLKSYVEGEVDYIHDRALEPRPLGFTVVKCKVNKSGDGTTLSLALEPRTIFDQSMGGRDEDMDS